MIKTELEKALKLVKDDIRSLTDLICVFGVSDNSESDKPMLHIIYSGIKQATITPGGITKEAEFDFVLKLTGRLSNAMQLANLMEAEIKTSKLYENTIDSDKNYRSLTGLSGYGVTYHTEVEEQKRAMNYDEFDRTWNLTIKIEKE